MRYFTILISFLLLSGCAINATGISRDTGETMSIHYQSNAIMYKISAAAGDESFRGTIVATGGGTISDEYGNSVKISGNTYRAVFVGDKGRTMRCELCGGLTSGIGSCITSDGEAFDVMW